jgi:hypothetical protein
MFDPSRRATLYGDCLESAGATRMLHDGRHKLIWYPAGNHVQLFDLEEDPGELRNRADDPDYAKVREHLIGSLIDQLYGIDIEDLSFIHPRGNAPTLVPRSRSMTSSRPGSSTAAS